MAEIKIIPESIKLLKISDKEYFSEKYKDYISNSRLGLLDPEKGGSIEKFEEGFSSGYSASFELGTAVHCRLLQQDEFIIADIQKPNGKLGEFVEAFYVFRESGLSIQEASKEASIKADYYSKGFTPKRFRTALEKSLSYYLKRIKEPKDSDKEILYLSEATHAKYLECKASIENNSTLLGYLNPTGLLSEPESANEYAMFCEAVVTIDGVDYPVKLKAKFDNYTIDHETNVVSLNDVKTTGKPVAYFMGDNVFLKGDTFPTWVDGSFEKFSYYRQMGMYGYLLAAALSTLSEVVLSDYSFKFNMLVVETIPEYNSMVYSVGKKDIEKGLSEFKTLLVYYIKWKNQLLDNY